MTFAALIYFKLRKAIFSDTIQLKLYKSLLIYNIYRNKLLQRYIQHITTYLQLEES